MTQVRALLVDDNALFARSAEMFLNADGRVKVLASARSGADALACIGSERPDLVLTDLHMPGMNGLELTRKIRERDVAVKIVLFSSAAPAQFAEAACQAGADAFLSKYDIATKLMPLIERLFGLRPRPERC